MVAAQYAPLHNREYVLEDRIPYVFEDHRKGGGIFLFKDPCLHDRLHASFPDLPHVLFPAFRDAESSISLL
jgi:hypothetical protein